MKNRIFAIILACLTLLSSLYIPSFAAEENEANDFTSTITEVVEECSHENKTHVSDLKKSDCKTGVIGIAKYKCDDCGKPVYEQLPLHTNDWLVTKKPTCGESGIKYLWCAICEQKLGEDVVIPATGEHTWNATETIVDPTCTEYGYAVYECSVCGYADLEHKQVIEDLAPLNHPETYDKTFDATCEDNAKVVTYCALCDEVVGEDDLYEASVAAGAEDLLLKKKEHAETKLVANGDGTHDKVCADCKTVIEENIECVYTTDVTDATCHTYKVTTYTCTCGYSYSVTDEDAGFDFTKHDYDVKAIKPATCTMNGIGKQVCKVCGATGDYMIIEKGHTWGEDYNVTPATCEEDGKATHKCSACNLEEIYTIETEGHTYDMVTTAKPNCGNTGLAVEMCTKCLTVKEGGATEVLPAVGEHAWSDTESHSNADCLNPGKVWIACTVCQAVKEGSEKVIDGANALGHDWDYVVKPATCTSNSVEVQFCARCTYKPEDGVRDLFEALGGEGVADPALKAFGHTLGSPVSDKNGNHTVSCQTCGEKLSESECTLNKVNVSVATCLKAEVNRYTCDECGYTVDKVEGEKNTDNHVWGKDKVIKPATCTTNGIKKQICECGFVGGYYVVEAAHTWGDPVYSVVPTCEGEGKATHVCKVCGAEEKDYTVPALDHTTEIVTTKNPTCGVAGSKIEMCLVCEKTFGEAIAIDPTGNHVYADTETVVDATCTTGTQIYFACTSCGAKDPTRIETLNDALGHKEESKHYDADCENPEREEIFCTVCKEILDTVDLSEELGADGNPVGSPALGHNYGEFAYATGGKHKAVCARCGDEDFENCEWENEIIPGTCQNYEYTKFTCTVCEHSFQNKTGEKDPTNHTYDKELIIKAPTCTTNGIAKAACACGAIRPENPYYLVPAAHTWDEPVYSVVPTCDGEGKASHVCKVCGVEEKDYTVPALGHKTEIVVTKNPTCGVAGSKIDTCTVCLKTFGDAIAINPTGNHTWVTEQTKDATCTEAAKVYTVCTVCKAEKDVVTVGDPLGHVDADGSEYRKPTCTTNGLDVSVCDRCKTEFDKVDLYEATGDEAEKALGHTYGGYAYADKDQHTRTCKVCQYVEKKAHRYGSAVTTVATCQKKEVTTYTCKDCKHAYTEETAAKNPQNHEWTEAVVKAPTCTASGIGKYVCACDSKLNNGYFLMPAAHSYDRTVVTAPTCTEPGAGVDTCKVCGVSVDVVIDATGHNMEFKVVTNPTCGVDGKKTEFCKVCGAEGETAAIDATGEHTWAAEEYIEEATCTHNAFVYIPCTVCSAAKDGVKHEVANSKLEHTELVTEYAADCENDARTVISCSVCQTEIQTINHYVASINPETGKGDDTLKALGHDWSEYVTVDGEHSRVCATCNKTEKAECSYVETSVAATCQKGAYTHFECSVCKDSYDSEPGEQLDATNHAFAEVIIKPSTDCNTTGIAKSACACGVVEEYYIIPAGHTWCEHDHISEISDTVYQICAVCGSYHIAAYFGEQDVEVGQVVDFIGFDSAISIVPTIDSKITLTISVKDTHLGRYHAAWIEVNGEKVESYDEVEGVYTFVYTTDKLSAILDTFEVRLFGEIAGILCAGDAETFAFDRVAEAPVVEAVPTKKIENATAFFAGRGVSIGDKVSFVYHITTNLPEGARLVLTNKDGDKIYDSIAIADCEIVNGVYVVEVEIDAANWGQVFAATICNAENTAISNTNYYSLAQYAALKIVADETNALSNLLRAMMAYIAE